MSEGAGRSHSYRSRALRGASLSAVGFSATQGLALAAYVVLANLISPEEFGLFAAGSAVLAIGLLVADSGMNAALVQRRDDIESAANTALIATVVVGLVLAGLALLANPVLGWAFGDPRVGQVTAALAGCFVLRAAALVPDALLQRRLSFVRRMVVEPLGVSAFAVVSVVACARGAGVWGLVAGTYASLLLQGLAAWAFVRWRPRLGMASVSMWRELIRYGRQVTVAELMRRTASQLDLLIVGNAAGLAGAGQYRNGMRLASQPLQAWIGIGAFVLFPTFVRVDTSRARLRHAVLRSLRWMCVGGFPLSLLLVAEGEHLSTALLGPQWDEAGRVIVALGLYPAGQMIVSLFGEVVKATGDTGMLSRVHGLALALVVPFALVGAVVAGAVGTGVAVSAISIACAVYAVVLLSRVLAIDVGLLWREIRSPALAAGAMTVLVLGLGRLLGTDAVDGRLATAALLVSESVVGLAAYAVVLSLLAPSLPRELLVAVRTMRRRASPVALSGGAPV